MKDRSDAATIKNNLCLKPALNFYFSDGSDGESKKGNFSCAYCNLCSRSVLQPCSANKENLKVRKFFRSSMTVTAPMSGQRINLT